MRIVITSNLANGIGLQRDYELLRGYLESLGHEVEGQQFDKPWDGSGTAYELCIFLETINEHLMVLAKRHWYIANPEWIKPEMVRAIHKCEKIFAKTHEAERVLKEKFSNVHYVGFLTEDKANGLSKTRKFLHIGGNSGTRGTNAVVEAWRSYRYWDETELPPLTVVSNSRETVLFEDTPGITFVKRATDEEITEFQNTHLFHLFPSATEGFGHAIHESQSVGAVLMTTAAPPMSELKAPFEVKPCGTKVVNMGTLYEVSPKDIREMVTKIVAQPSHVIARMQSEARLRFEKGNREFKELFDPHLDRPALRLPTLALHSRMSAYRGFNPEDRTLASNIPPLRIAMLGNFIPPHSTENELLWTLRYMGNEVITFQENEDATESILAGTQGCTLFLYIHTHGYETPGKITVHEMLAALRGSGIKTASFHLDRYVGLDAIDGRESRVGTHPFWRTDTVFTADGGNAAFFKGRGINHVWLPPGVVKHDCHFGTMRDNLRVDVGFVGAESYHPEWNFRAKLIEFLRAVYGDRFRVFTGFRGKDLNDLYASVRVLVGDSCFAGSDYYWSDRVPETLGRGGFLIHPATKGLTIPGLVTFEAGNLPELQDRIDYYLAHEEEREALRCAGHKWVRENETYSNRMSTLLKVCGLG